jgi:hypothetical protein
MLQFAFRLFGAAPHGLCNCNVAIRVYVTHSDHGMKSYGGIIELRAYNSLLSMTYTNEPKVTVTNKEEQKDIHCRRKHNSLKRI